MLYLNSKDNMMEIINTEWGLNSYLELKNRRVFTDSEYREVLKPDVMLLQSYPDNEKFNQSKFWSPATERDGKIMSDCYKMKWHQIGNGRIQLRLTVMIRGKQCFLCEAYVKEDEKTDRRMLAKLKAYAELIRRGQYTICGKWGKPT
jgi:hypothetical protein